MIETLIEENKKLATAITKNENAIAELCIKELTEFVKSKSGEINFKERIYNEIDPSDAEWINMITMRGSALRTGFPYKVTFDKYLNEELIFYGFSDTGEDVYIYAKGVKGMSLYYILKFFKTYSEK